LISCFFTIRIEFKAHTTCLSVILQEPGYESLSQCRVGKTVVLWRAEQERLLFPLRLGCRVAAALLAQRAFRMHRDVALKKVSAPRGIRLKNTLLSRLIQLENCMRVI
jgi:hypothetical protein